jgi:beta-lactamase class A
MKLVLVTCVLVLLAGVTMADAVEESGADALRNEIEAIEKETGGTIGVTAIHLAHGQRLDHRADEVFPAASVIKTHLLVVLYRRAERGELSLDDALPLREQDKVGGSGRLQHEAAGTVYSLGELARLMIVISDNVATNMLIGRLGGMESINKELGELGIERSRFNRLMMDAEARSRGIENAITPGETAALFATLERRAVAKPETCDAILAVLLAQELSSKMPSLLPEGTRVAHKTGTLTAVSHDAGIIYAPSGPIAVAVLTKGIANEETSRQAIARVARLVFDAWGAAAGDEAKGAGE